MKEYEAYKTVINHQIVNDDSIKRYARTATPVKPFSVSRVWKPIGIAFAVLVLAFSITMTIPSARAEVLSWFRPASTEDYISTSPMDRDPIPEIDEMIVTPSLNQTDVKVNYCADEPYWREIGQDFSATLGETIYDGQDILVTIDFDGLSGYAIYDGIWNLDISADTPVPSLLAEKISPEKITDELRADASPYLSGVRELWSEPNNVLILTLDDGTELDSDLINPVNRPVDERFFRSFPDVFLLDSYYREVEYLNKEDAEAIKTGSWEHYKANGLRAIAYIHFTEAEISETHLQSDRTLAEYIDENGSLTLHVRYVVSIDHGDENETKLDVDLGTIAVKMNAYKELAQHSFETHAGSVALSGDAVFGHNDTIHSIAANYSTKLNGVTLEVIDPGTIDLLGIHDMKIAVTMPDDWSDEMRLAFFDMLDFEVFIDEDMDFFTAENADPDALWTANIRYYFPAQHVDSWNNFLNNGISIFSFDVVNQIPFDRIRSMHTITLIPVLTRMDEVLIYKYHSADDDKEWIKTEEIGPNDSFNYTEYASDSSYDLSIGGSIMPLYEFAITLKLN